MLERIRFQNFKALRDTTLELQPFTLLVGPNGSGKSSALAPFSWWSGQRSVPAYEISKSIGAPDASPIAFTMIWAVPKGYSTILEIFSGGGSRTRHEDRNGHALPNEAAQELSGNLRATRIFQLDAPELASQVNLQPSMELQSTGRNLAGVLDQLRDKNPERFEELNQELGRWLPEFDRILFETPTTGHRTFRLRTRKGQHSLPASEISQGTLLALGILTLAYLPSPPTLVGLEEPDRGIHPRLLRDVRDAIYRLTHPEKVGEKRPPVQVIATTHSPYMLDLYRDHPEEIVIASKTEGETNFQRLSDRSDLDEILRDSHLGDAWYSGILGGVPGRK